MLTTRATTRTSTLVPFLYATPTILRQSPQDRLPTRARRRVHNSASKNDTTEYIPVRRLAARTPIARAMAPASDVPFNTDRDMPAADGMDGLDQEDILSKRTLTVEERSAFQRLFSRFGEANMAKMDRARPKAQARALAQDSEDEIQKLLAEIDGSLPSEEPELQEDLSRFPEYLRGMAMRAEYTRAKSGQQSTLRNTTTAEGSTRLRAEYAELKHIYKALHDATTDADVWHVLCRDVFPGMRQIQRYEEPSAELQSAVTSGDAETDFDGDADTDGPSIVLTDERHAVAMPKFTLLVRAYPALVLSAMRILNRRALYSPYISMMIPTMRGFGLGAYTLGISTALYNEQLEFQWRIMHDVAAMLATLDDMAASGIAPDQKTTEILAQVYQYRKNALAGMMGEAARQVEQFVARAADSERLNERRNEIKGRLEQQELAKMRRARNERSLQEEGVFE